MAMGTDRDETESVCPVCLRRIGARRVPRGTDWFLEKECPDHGRFSTVIWRGEPSMTQWKRPKEPVRPEICYGTDNGGCPFDCGLCAEHRQLPCSVLIEVTDRCNLHCPVCFADSGAGQAGDLPIKEISGLLQRAIAAAGPSNLQLSGGEPTLRDDLPEIVEAARGIGYTFIQVNTNGIRLSSDLEYAKRLRAAGLSSVFLQFDGVDDEVYWQLRGRALLEAKLRVIENCGRAGLGVVLVPTLVKGVNTGAVGAILRRGLQMAPVVRGIHFQPVSYFGRFSGESGSDVRFTLPELMRALEEQTDGIVRVEDFSPPGCEHERCSFHATYVQTAKGGLRPLRTGIGNGGCCSSTGGGGVGKTVEIVSRRWKPGPAGPVPGGAPLATGSCCSETIENVSRVEGPIVDLDLFLAEAAAGTFTISAMAFQDAENLDLERLRGCCISVVSPEGTLVPFCAYNLTSRKGTSLYRRAVAPSTV